LFQKALSRVDINHSVRSVTYYASKKAKDGKEDYRKKDGKAQDHEAQSDSPTKVVF
jgi:hypothetical protein